MAFPPSVPLAREGIHKYYLISVITNFEIVILRSFGFVKHRILQPESGKARALIMKSSVVLIRVNLQVETPSLWLCLRIFFKHMWALPFLRIHRL